MKSCLRFLVAVAALSLIQISRAEGRNGPPQSPAQSEAPPGATAEWKRYTYTGEEFSVELPEMPIVYETSRDISMFESERMRVFSLYSGGVVFFVNSYDKPRPQETLERFASYHLGGRGLTPAGDASLDGFEGREYQLKYSYNNAPPSFFGRARVFRARKHAYLVEAYSDTEGHEQEIERFLNSLALSAKPSGEGVLPDSPIPPFKPPKPPPKDTGGGDAPLKLSPEAAPSERPPEGPFTQKEVTRKAVIVFKPEPSFTEDARKNNVSGVVRLRAVLSSTGLVTDISVIKWLRDGLTEKAIGAARHIRFFPAEKDGRAVSQYVVLEYNFNIY